MDTISEKIIYKNEFIELSNKINTDIFVWGEDLINRKIIPYPKSVKVIYEYECVKDSLEQCAVILINKNKDKYFYCILTLIDTITKNIYINVQQFNSIWKVLRNSINKGISIAKGNGNCTIHKPEDIVVLDNLSRVGSDPIIKNYKIQYLQRNLTDKEKYRNSRKQSLFDNPKMLYFYEDGGEFYHDKDCYEVKKMQDNKIKASEQIPNKKICYLCRRRLYIRNACYPNAKQIPLCNRIFKNNNIGINLLNHFVMQVGMRFHPKSLDEMIVVCREETWLIKGLQYNKLELWHNNYISTTPNEKYVTSGFHKQNVEDLDFLRILKYIEHHHYVKNY